MDRYKTIYKDITKTVSNHNQKRAKVGGEYGPNGEWYKGGAWIATTNLPKAEREKLIRKSSGKVEVAPYKWEQPKPGFMSIYEKLDKNLIDSQGNINTVYQNYSHYTHEQVNLHKTLRGLLDKGEQWISVYEYPDLANVKDAIILLVNNMAIPGVLLDKVVKQFPKINDYIQRWND